MMSSEMVYLASWFALVLPKPLHPDFRRPVAYGIGHLSSVVCRMSNVKCQMSNVVCRMSIGPGGGGREQRLDLLLQM